MATKGPKTGAAKPAVRKPAARATAAPGKVAVPEVEKPVPAEATETIVQVPFVEPVPALEAATQEVTNIVETVAEPIVEAAAETAITAAGTVEETAAAPEVKETVKMATVYENSTVENATTKAQALFGEWNERTKAAVEKSTKLVEEANEFAKGNVEALVESGRIAAKGFEGLGQDAAEYGRKSFESATAAMKSFSSVKSPADFFKLQSDFFRTSFDAYVAEASKNTEALIKLASDAAQPLSNRVAVAAEKVKTVA